MITMRNWLLWKRKGIDVFAFNEQSVLSAYCEQEEYDDFNEFVKDLRFFFVADKDIKQPDEDDETKRIHEETVWSILAYVPNWMDLTWYECVMYANAKVENAAAGRSQLMCLIHNVHCDNKKNLMKPEDFNSVVQAKRAAAEKALRKKYCSEDYEQLRLARFMEATEPQTKREGKE